MRIIKTDDTRYIKAIMQDIGADKVGIRIMAPKSILYLIKLRNLACFGANILKQQVLSLGGDVCLSRDAITQKARLTDCLIMATAAQFHHLVYKLKEQPFGLNRIADEISLGLVNYQSQTKKSPKIMGIVNLTPDSFSGDGLYASCVLRHTSYVDKIIEFVEKMVKDGADIIDVGGESSRPGAKPVSISEELARTIPVIKVLAKKVKVRISIDTYKPEVARQALDNGASIVNDITGLRNSEMLKVLAKAHCDVVIMHMKGKPRTMQNNPQYKSLMDEIIEYLKLSIEKALDYGIAKEKIIVDPGIGFGKTLAHNLEILRSLRELKVLGCPILVGPSRKSFIGNILNLPAQDRLNGTLASVVVAVMNGADIVRVHDVKPVAQTLKITEAILNC